MILSDLKLHSVLLRALPQVSIRHASIEQDLGMGFRRGMVLILYSVTMHEHPSSLMCAGKLMRNKRSWILLFDFPLPSPLPLRPSCRPKSQILSTSEGQNHMGAYGEPMTTQCNITHFQSSCISHVYCQSSTDISYQTTPQLIPHQIETDLGRLNTVWASHVFSTETIPE